MGSVRVSIQQVVVCFEEKMVRIGKGRERKKRKMREREKERWRERIKIEEKERNEESVLESMTQLKKSGNVYKWDWIVGKFIFYSHPQFSSSHFLSFFSLSLFFIFCVKGEKQERERERENKSKLVSNSFLFSSVWHLDWWIAAVWLLIQMLTTNSLEFVHS